MGLHDANVSRRCCDVRMFMVALLTTLFVLNMLSLTAAKRVPGQAHGQTFGFEFVTVTLLQEILKLVVACLCLRHELGPGLSGRAGAGEGGESKALVSRRRNALHFPDCFLYAIPGLLYCLDTNSQYIILSFLEPAELAILWNFKVLATAILLSAFLDRRYTSCQWLALMLLVLGCALTQVPHQGHQPEPAKDYEVGHGDSDFDLGLVSRETLASPQAGDQAFWPMPAKFVGACLAVLGSCVAASSNVFCEWLVKRSPQDSIHLQNLQLSLFGVAMNVLALWVKASSEPDSPVHHEGGFFTGYSCWVWAVVILGSIGGLAVSFTLKFMDNVAVLFAHALSVLIASSLSAKVFGVQLSLPFAGGGTLVLVALLIFHAAEGRDVGGACQGSMDTGCSSWSPSPRPRDRDNQFGERAGAEGGTGGVPVVEKPMYCLSGSQ